MGAYKKGDRPKQNQTQQDFQSNNSMPSIWGLYLWDVTSTEMRQRHCNDLGASIPMATLGFTLLIVGILFLSKMFRVPASLASWSLHCSPALLPQLRALSSPRLPRGTAHGFHAFLWHLGEKSMVSLVCLSVKLVP